MTRPMFIGSLALMVVVGIAQASAQQHSIKLFDATPTFESGPQTSPAEAIPFASKSLLLDFTSTDTAVISSTPDGTGPIAIDNFMTINGVNICNSADQLYVDSCFGSGIDNNPTGVPIETVLTPIRPIDVTSLIPVGQTTVGFELRDFGVIAGNTDLFLVTTARNIQAQPQPPSTSATAFDVGMGLFAAQLKAAVEAKFQEAFEEQVGQPVRTALRDANADPEKIEEVEGQLTKAKAERASLAAISLDSLLNSRMLLSELQRNTDPIFQQPAASPMSMEDFVTSIGSPTIRSNQSIDDILKSGFNPALVEFDWQAISASANFIQNGAPILASKASGGVTATIDPKTRKPVVTGKLNGTFGPVTVGVEETCTQGGGGCSTSFTLLAETPEIQGGGSIALFTFGGLIALLSLRNRLIKGGFQPELVVRGSTEGIGVEHCSVTWEFLCRASLSLSLAMLAHQFSWEWLRFATSEAILRISAALGMASTRCSFDTILVQGELFQFVTACTFVDVFLGSLPLIWNRNKSVTRNVLQMIAAAAILFCFNIVRLEIGQILYSRGILSHIWTDSVLGGFSYFAVWLVIWNQRSWQFLTRSSRSEHAICRVPPIVP